MEKEKYKDLPLVDINDDSFFYLNDDKNEERIINLVNKYIIFELKNNDEIMMLPGKLLSYKDKMLFIRQYDDGTERTKSLWSSKEKDDLFKDWEEKISIDNIRGIEEYKKANNDIEFKNEYKNHICEITNKDNVTIIVLINDFDGYEIEFTYKYKQGNDELVGVNYYPLYLIKNIKVL